MGNQVDSTIKYYCCKNAGIHVQNKKEVNFTNEPNMLAMSMNNEAIKTFDKPYFKKELTQDMNNMGVMMPSKKQDCIIDVTYAYNNTKEIDRIKQLQQNLHKASRLILKVINSITLPKGTTLVINAQGLEGSLRGKKDGITYFGCKKKSKPLNENFETAEILNDFIIKNKDTEANNKHRGRHFQIEYSLETNSYKIKDLGIGFGAFVKIDQPLLLKDNNLLSMGSSFLIINFNEELKDSFIYSNSQEYMENINPNCNNNNTSIPFGTGPINGGHNYKRNSMNSPLLHNPASKRPYEIENNSNNNSKSNPNLHANAKNSNDMRRSISSMNSASDITVKIFGGPNYGDVYQFSSNIPVIKIGRMPDCEIRIEDNLLSKYQGSIKYTPGTGWLLYDGYNGKPSTNSNWLYLNDDFELYNNMIFKANHTLFEVNIEPPLSK